MQRRYRVELFNRDYSFYSKSSIEPPALNMDYLTLEKSEIRAKEMDVLIGLFAQIVDESNTVILQGIVNDFQTQNGVTEISIAPLLSLLDVTVTYDRTLLQNGPIEEFIKTVIMNTYANNQDALQNIPGTECITTSSTQTYLNIKSNVHEFWDICSRALTVYGVSISACMDVQDRTIVFTIGTVDGISVIEPDLRNCLNKVFSVGDMYGATNKATYINKQNEAQRVTYYLHADGTISEENRDRIHPVFFTNEYVDANDFDEEARSRAIESLTPEQYNNLAELTYKETDMLVHPESLVIGKKAKIIGNGYSYDSILTGWSQAGAARTLYFGIVRIELTKKIIIGNRSAGQGTHYVASESGNNSYGNWVRFPDGTQICWRRLPRTTYSSTTAFGALYITPLIQLGTWAQPFISPPVRTIDCGSSSGGNEIIVSGLPANETGAGSFYIGTAGSGTTVSDISVMGIGRWK